MTQTLSLPKWNARARWLSIVYGVVIFFWLGVEDNDVIGVTVLGMAGAVLLVWSVVSRVDISLTTQAGRYIGLPLQTGVIGGSLGVTTSVATAVLMLAKDVRHAHAFPDYPPAMIGDMLERAPLWGLAGMLIGLSAGLLWWVRNNS